MKVSIFTLAVFSAVLTGKFIFGEASTISSLPKINGALEISVIGTYESGEFDESAAEIVVHDPCTQRVFVVNAKDDAIDVIDISNPATPSLIGQISLPVGFAPNSVAFISEEQAIAVAAGNSANPANNGRVFFFDVEDDNSFSQISSVEVGNLPDMLTITPNKEYILVANEGERLDEGDEVACSQTDPEGSVSIIYIGGGLESSKLKVATLGFGNLDKTALVNKGVRIAPTQTVAEDLEPEYIAVDPSSEYAYVALQENNAVLKIDIKEFAKLLEGGSFQFENDDFLPLGVQDYAEVYIDPSDRDGFGKDEAFKFQLAPGTDLILGLRMPDAVAVFEDKEGDVFFATANEGDSRDPDCSGWISDEERIKDLDLDPIAFPNAEDVQEDEKFGRLVASTVDGLNNIGQHEKIFTFGSRSFSIFDKDGNLVFDSGSDFEYITYGANPHYFNSDNDEASFDTRSDAKGPEPEALEIGKIDDRIYAFIGLERVGGIMVYDITEPSKSFFVTYFNNRDFTVDQETSAAGDLGPEGIKFIDKDDSPTGNYMLVVANEVSGTTTLYDIATVGTCTGESKGGGNKKRRTLLESDVASSNNVKDKFTKRRSTGGVRNLKPAKKCGKKKR